MALVRRKIPLLTSVVLYDQPDEVAAGGADVRVTSLGNTRVTSGLDTRVTAAP